MTKIRPLKDPSILEVAKAKDRTPSPRILERQAEYERFRGMVRGLTDTSKVFEIELDEGEKPLTVKQRLRRVAAEEGKEIAIRRYRDGFAVGLMTPERRDRRGRRKSK